MPARKKAASTTAKKAPATSRKKAAAAATGSKKAPPLANRLLTPIRSIIERVLPEFADQLLSDPQVRARLIDAVDTTLISEYPAARALPESLRRDIIGKLLDLLLNLIKGPAPTPAAKPTGRTRRGAQAAPKPPAKAEPLTLAALNLSDSELELLEATAPGNSVGGFLLDTHKNDPKGAAAAVDAVLGKGWKVTRLDPKLNSYRATHPTAILSVPAAWTLSHTLEEHKAIALAEPEIVWVPAPAAIGGTPPDVARTMRRAASAETHLSCSSSPVWHLNIVGAEAAWGALGLDKDTRGKGVTIGHLDTGVTHHAEVPLDSPRILVSKGRNIFDPQNPKVKDRPLDPWIEGFMQHPGHGTRTISVIVGRNRLTGSATAAKVIPYRIGPTVVHFNAANIAAGITQAHADGCDVISMSMGGPPTRTKYLDEVVARAAEDGVILCTAAGNQIGSNNVTPLVVWPAALDQVIAVAGCNCQLRVWTGSSRGPEVNITAGAQDVWRANPNGNLDTSTPPTDSIGQGHGTSFATPTVAGMAACWLSLHGGRKALITRYGHPRFIPLAFAHLLRTVASYQPAEGWNTGLMGPGIMDAEKLLKAPLPAKSVLTGWPRKTHPWFGKFAGGLFKIINGRRSAAAARAGRPAPRASRAAGAPSSAGAAARFEGELAYHLFDRPAAITLLTAAQPASAAAPAAAPNQKPNKRRRAGVAASAAPHPTATLAAEDGSLEEAADILRAIGSAQLQAALRP